MVTEKKTETTLKNVTFRFGDEDFKVQLKIVSTNDGKIESVSDSTQRFFDYLQELHIISSRENSLTWLSYCTDSSLITFSNPTHSLKIRKKAQLLGLQVIPGENFKKRKEESYQRAIQSRYSQRQAVN